MLTRKTTRPKGNFELFSWFYMRISGALLVIFIFIHLAFVHFVHGVGEINSGFVAKRWANPTWLLSDILMLSIALTHGANGMRILAEDYIRPKGWRTLFITALYTLVAFLIVVGITIMLRMRAA